MVSTILHRANRGLWRTLRQSQATNHPPSATCLRPFHARPAKRAQAAPAFFSSAHKDSDADAIRDFFDSLSQSKVQASNHVTASQTSGLFGSPSLSSPAAFIPLAQRTLLRAQLLVHRIVTAPQNGDSEMRKVVKNLDRLSDLLCAVIDLSELVRNAHPDDAWRDAANEAYEGLCGFMNVLNTHTGLYEVLSKVLTDDGLRSALSPEGLAVAQGFHRDFEKSGIHLPSKQRERFVELSDDILVLGRAFMQQEGSQIRSRSHVAKFKRSWFEGAQFNLLGSLLGSPALISASSSSEVHIDVNAATWEFPTILRFCANEAARKEAYTAMNTAHPGNIDILEQLLRKRSDLAQLTGHDSYATMTLGDKMAQRPESVQRFLEALESHHRPLAASKLGELEALKAHASANRETGASSSSSRPFEAWDRDHYAEMHLRRLASATPGNSQPISSFFSVGNVFSGLSRMLSCLYGIRLRLSNVGPGEAWDSDVVKLQVVEEDASSSTGETVIGTVYADLFARPGKPPSAAHYTVRCSRRVDDDDHVGDFQFGRLQDGREVEYRPDLAALPLEVHQRPNPGRPGLYQQPIVVLLCDFVRAGSGGSTPSLLSWTEVETLFHEMGHAIHSMIGRTEHHNVSGTRCATDLVELPSILMEHFVSSPAVVGLIARHHATGLPLPYDALQKHFATGPKALDDLDTHNQILLAMLDQRYHGLDFSGDSTMEMALLYAQMGLIKSESGQLPYLQRQTWHSQFSHLFGYGATYYSYLLDRVLASQVWARVFAADPLRRENGERYKDRLLRWGGGREGWSMVGDLLDERDELSMKKVGQWGLKAR